MNAEDLNSVRGGGDLQGTFGAFEAQEVFAGAGHGEGSELADVIRFDGEGHGAQNGAVFVEQLDIEDVFFRARDKLHHQALLVCRGAVFGIPIGREFAVARRDVDAGDFVLMVNGEAVLAGGMDGEDFLHGVIRVEHADVFHDPACVEILFIELNHVPLTVEPNLRPGVVAADVVPGGDADGASGNAEGAVSANH